MNENSGMISAQQKLAKRILVRRAEISDASGISALLFEAFEEFQALYTREAFAATVLDPQQVRERLQQGPAWVVEVASSLVGTMAAVPHEDSIVVRGMAVSPSSRGMGVAKVLLDEAEKFAAEQSARILALYTTAFLQNAICLYQGLGFAFTGEKINPHGTDLLRMTKLLPH